MRRSFTTSWSTGRSLRPAREVPLTSSIALGELIGRLDLGRDDPLVPAFLDAVGDAGQGWWALAGQDSINADRHLNPLRWPAAVLLSEQSARVWEAIDPLHPDPAGGSADGSSKARMQALVGEIAKDVPTSPDGAATPRGLRMLLASLATSEAQRLGEQVDAAPPGTRPVALDEAAMRLGQVVGFTAESATVALRHAGEQVDAVNAKERSVVHGLTGGADLVPLPKGHPATAVLSLIRDPVLQVVTTAFDNAHPVNNAAMVTAREEVLMGQAQQLVTTSAGGQVLARLGHQAASQVQVGLAATNVRTGAGAVNREGPAPIAAP